jgi:hypothetical protein
VEIPEAMQRAMARQAEAQRERRAKIINAAGELQAAEKLADAAAIIGREPSALQLRYLQTLLEVGADQNSTIVFPLPLHLIKPFLERAAPVSPRAGGRSRTGRRPSRTPWPCSDSCRQRESLARTRLRVGWSSRLALRPTIPA